MNLINLCKNKELVELLNFLEHGKSYLLEKSESGDFYIFPKYGNLYQVPVNWFIKPSGNYFLQDCRSYSIGDLHTTVVNQISINELGVVVVDEDICSNYIFSEPLPLFLNDTRKQTGLTCFLDKDGNQQISISSMYNDFNIQVIIGFITEEPDKINLDKPFEFIALLSKQNSTQNGENSKIERTFIKEYVPHLLKIERLGNNFYKFWTIKSLKEGPEQKISFFYFFKI